MRDKDKSDVRLLIMSEKVWMGYGDSSSYLRVEVHPVYVNESGEVRNFVADSLSDEPLADLRIGAQSDSSMNHFYGYDVKYRDVWSVDLARAQSMAKTLRKIDRELRKIEDSFGYAESFASYLARVGKVIGAKGYGIMMPYPTVLNGSRYKWFDATHLSHHFDSLLEAEKEHA